MKNKTLNKIFTSVFAFVFWIFIWDLIAKNTNLPFVLPTPFKVFKRLAELIKTLDFYKVIATSFLRILWGFLTGSILGFSLGFCANLLSFIKILTGPIMSVIRATPVASFILVVLFWTNTSFVPTLISLLMVLPIIYENTLLGFKSKNPSFEELKNAFRISPVKGFFKVDLPQVSPFIFSAEKTALGLAWKAGVAAEVLALPKVSIGYMIYNAKMYLETVDLYAWTFAIIFFSILLEKGMELILSSKEAEHA